jgi:ADP-ribosyl-[dinitrogen reductase] hydrolase
MLLGLHTGDSLGAPLEFGPSLPDLSHRSMTGGGSFDWRPGQATDDTDLALLVLKAIKGKSSFDLAALRKSLVEYLDAEPVDIGNTTASAIGRLKNGEAFGGTENEDEQGNGSLMRVAPLALLDLPDAEIISVIEQQARLTHAHINCLVADRCFVRALKASLNGAQLNEVRAVLLNSVLDFGPFAEHLTGAESTDWDELPNSGWVVHSLHVLIWSLFNCESFEDALVKVVNLGGDADTNGAICGALWGAIEGVDAIPQSWLAALERREHFEELLKDY